MLNPVLNPTELDVEAVDFYECDGEVIMCFTTLQGMYEMSLLPTHGVALAQSLSRWSLQVMNHRRR